MRKVLLIALFLFVSSSVYAIGDKQKNNIKEQKLKAVLVKKDVNISLNPTEERTSKNISKSRQIEAYVADDLVVDDVIVATLGNPAILIVEEAQKARSFGRGGKIVIKEAIFYDNNNYPRRVNVNNNNIIIGDNDILLTRIIPFNKGHQAAIMPSMRFSCSIITSFTYADGLERKNKVFSSQKKRKRKF